MRLAVRRFAACLLCCVVGLALLPVIALGNGSSSEAPQTGEGSGASSSLEGSLVIPGSPTEAEQLRAQEEAKRSSPEAVAEREESRTEFEGLNTEQAAKVAGESFPAVIHESAGGPPKLPAGQSITSFPTDDAAQVDLGEGNRGVIESTAPIALETSSGQRTPVDLSLSDVGNAFEPKTPAVGVRIPKQLGEGVVLAIPDVSLTPVDARGTPLGGSEGVLDGATVFYGETETDSDTVIKPTTAGFEEDTMLRSVESPQQLYFRVGLPAGASLVQEEGSGSVQIVKEGVTIATIPAPAANDAAETSVPLHMSVSGDTLVLSVDDSSGEYQFPVEVDPYLETNDNQLVETAGGKRSNWKWVGNEAKFGHEPNEGPNKDEGSGKGYLETKGIAEYAETEKAYWAYQTKGVSKIYQFNAKTEGKNKGAEIESFLELEHSGVSENKETLSSETKTPEYGLESAPTLCAKSGEKVECSPTAGTAGNVVRFQQSVQKKPSNYGFSDSMHEGIVYLAEPEKTHSETKFNTTSPEVDGEVEEGGKKVKQKRPNALYGSGGWLSKYQDALEPIAKDGGIGVAKTRLEYESAPGKWEQVSEHNYLEKENGCEGVQCYSEHKEYWTVEPKLPNGEDKIRYRAEEAIAGTESLEAEAESTKTVKVDTSPPHRISIVGLPFGNELSERPYKLKVEATDGEGTTIASSGVASIKMSVDGKEEVLKKIGGTGECSTPKGECTAYKEWEINGAELGAGHHSIQVVTFDKAGNEGRLPGGGTEISIRHSTPVTLGPGSVDLESGDFSLGATDVSMGSGLTLSRAYSSRATEEGDEGPLGADWSMSMANTESLVEIPDGSLLMTAANGSQTIFAKPLAGVKCESTTPFESPPGDSNLKLWCEENKTTKAREAYYLENAADHTKVKFTLPTGGTTAWVPAVQEGAVPTDTVTYKYQTASSVMEYLVGSTWTGAITSGPSNSLWFGGAGAINRIPLSGTTVTEYQLPKHEEVSTESLVTGPEGNVWFTTVGNIKTVGKITPSGKITQYSLPGEKHEAGGMTVGPEGNMWFTMRGWEGSGEYIAKITPSGVITPYPVPGEANKITPGPNGEAALWFTDYFYARIGRISTTSDSVTEYTSPGGGPSGIVAGRDGKLWFADTLSNSIGTINTSGEGGKSYPLPEKSAPSGITSGPEGNLWFTDGGTSKIGKITTSGSVTEYALPGESRPGGITTGPDGKMWFSDESSEKIGTITTSGTITEPTEVRAPVPSGVSCSWTVKPTEMKPGCRSLEFKYATGTSATGEGENEWGEYNRRLAKVSAVAYNPSTKAMEEKAVAEYSYDKFGRLRAEWDPRISPALKTTYGYDTEDHVTALSPPGQEPWSLTYGTSTGDSGTGRLVKATRAPASESLWSGEVVKNTEAPKITGSPVVGVRLAASSGKWSGSPLTYGYQWQECNSENECTAILGANNANYTPVASNIGHTLVALVTASNGGGSNVTVTAATAAVTGGSVTQSVDSGNSLNAVSCVPASTDCVLSDSKGNALYATNVSTGAIATWKTWTGPTGESPSQAAACPASSLCLLADGKGSAGGYMYYATSLGGAWTNAFEPSYGVDAISCASASFCIDGQGESGGYIRYSTTPGSTSWTAEDIGGSTSIKGVFCLSSSFCAAVDNVGDVYVATSTTQIESATWTKTDVDGTSALNGVACTSTTSCVVVDGAGNLINLAISEGKGTATKHNIDGTNSLTAVTCTGTSTCATVDNAGNVFGSKNGGETWTKVYALGDNLTSVSCASTTLCATADTTGNVTAFSPAGATGTEGELHNPGPGTTIDYSVPLEGSSAPYQMGENEATKKPEPEKWGQSDDPVEATAIIAADSPQGSPASSYKRATVYYLDEEGREVNVASPSSSSYGAIATTEFNETNNVTKTLSADNRVTALEAGEAKSAEVAKSLATFYTYRPMCSKESENNHERESGEPGTRLCEVEGSEHKVKYAEGKEQKEALARNQVRYFYDENIPNEAPFNKETFNVVTETTESTWLPATREDREAHTTRTSYSGQKNLGWKLRAPTSVTIEPNGVKATTTSEYNEATGQVTQTLGAGAEGTFTYAAKFGEAGTEAGKLKTPFGMAIDSRGDLWVADEGNSRLEEFGAAGEYLSTFGKAGSEAGQLKEPKGIAIDSKADIWVAESGNNRVQEFSPEGKSLLVFGKAGSGNGELKEPKALAIDSKGDIWVADTGNNRMEEFSAEGKYVSSFGKAGTEAGELKEPKGIAIDSKGDIWVADTGNNRIQEFTPGSKLLNDFGASGAGAGQFKTPFGLAFDAAGNLWVTDEGNNRIQELSSTGAFIGQFGWKGSEAGQLDEPRDIAIDAQGEVWVTDTANNRLEKFATGPNARNSKIIYYGSEEKKEGYENCGKHPEWAGLICETLPAKQPELSGLPKLPITTTTYNMWNEPEKVEEKFVRLNAEKHEETTIRTKKEEYDEAGRLKTSETTSSTSEDTALPKVSNKYNTTLGLLEEQSTTVGTKTKTITNKANKLGERVEYIDSDGNIAKYKYAGPENDGLLEEMSDSSDEGKSSQKYSYDETTKRMTKLVDSAAGTFTAGYDAEGKMTSEVYPNEMCANNTFNAVGEAIAIEYKKTSNCAESKAAVWFSETRVPSARGEIMSRSSTLSSETYTYEPLGRLTETEETPVGEGCTTRIYAYDEASDRARLTTRKPGGEGKCAAEGGTVEAHNYDEAGRLTDEGIAYEAFGNATKLPAGDAEAHELKSTFYVDGAVASQEQNGTKNEYFLDPVGRQRYTVSGTKRMLSHYDASGEAVAWSCEATTSETCEASAKWTRNIPGIDGTLAATQEGEGKTGKQPVLQLHDLKGDIVATIGDNTSETKLLSTYNSTEFGVPNGGKAPPPYAWLGASGVASSLATGVITYGATSYVPQTGRSLQHEEVEPPGAPGGTGAGAQYTDELEPWVLQGATREANEAPAIGVTEERAAAAAACLANPAAACTLTEGGDPACIEYLSFAASFADATLIGVGHVLSVADITADLKQIFHIDFLDQFKEYVVHAILGINKSEIEDWFYHLQYGLEECIGEIVWGPHDTGNNPTCEVFYDTNIHHVEVPFSGLLGHPIYLYEFPIPNFAIDPGVAVCPVDEGTCYSVET